MENTARYTLIGLFTLACILASFAFVYWIKNVGGLGARAYYDIRFQQPVSGLTEGASVLFNGIRAGTVAKIALDPNSPKRVTVNVSMDPTAPVRADTKVDVTYLGLTGAAAIALIGGTPDAPRLTPQNGRTPLLVAGEGAGRTLTESAQDTVRHIDELVSTNSKAVTTAINGISTFADMLGRNAQRVEGVIGGLEKLTGAGGASKGPDVFDLAAATGFADTPKEIAAPLAIPDPSTLILFDSQKILTRGATGTYGNIDNAQWADNLPKLVQARLVQSFENAHQLKMVSKPLDSMNPDRETGNQYPQLPDRHRRDTAGGDRSGRPARERQRRNGRGQDLQRQRRGQERDGGRRGRRAQSGLCPDRRRDREVDDQRGRDGAALDGHSCSGPY